MTRIGTMIGMKNGNQMTDQSGVLDRREIAKISKTHCPNCDGVIAVEKPMQ